MGADVDARVVADEVAVVAVVDEDEVAVVEVAGHSMREAAAGAVMLLATARGRTRTRQGERTMTGNGGTTRKWLESVGRADISVADTYIASSITKFCSRRS